MNHSILVVTAASALFYGTPLLYAALGELLAERSGVLNLGVEGMMLRRRRHRLLDRAEDARAGRAVLLVAAARRRAGRRRPMALIHAFLVITLRANQTVSGLALTIFAGAAGLSTYLGSQGKLGGQPAHHAFRALDVFGLADAPDPRADPLPPERRSSTLSWVAWSRSSSWYLFRTRTGLEPARRRRVARRGRRDRHQRRAGALRAHVSAARWPGSAGRSSRSRSRRAGWPA